MHRRIPLLQAFPACHRPCRPWVVRFHPRASALREILVEPSGSVRGNELPSGAKRRPDVRVDPRPVHPSAERAIERVPEFMADRHHRSAANVRSPLLNDEEPRRWRGPCIDIDPESYKRRGGVSIALALVEWAHFRAALGGESKGGLAECFERSLDLCADRGACSRNQR